MPIAFAPVLTVCPIAPDVTLFTPALTVCPIAVFAVANAAVLPVALVKAGATFVATSRTFVAPVACAAFVAADVRTLPVAVVKAGADLSAAAPPLRTKLAAPALTNPIPASINRPFAASVSPLETSTPAFAACNAAPTAGFAIIRPVSMTVSAVFRPVMVLSRVFALDAAA